MKKLIELWKMNCEHCEAVEPIVGELEKEGYVFEKHNIDTPKGEQLWTNYSNEIDSNNKTLGYEQGFIYTPTFINPQTRTILSLDDREPTKAELTQLAEGGESK